MSIDLNIAGVLGFLVVGMISIIAYFLNRIITQLDTMQKEGMQRSLELARLDSDIRSLKEENTDIKNKIRTYDTNIEAFWKDFSKLINEAVSPHFELINRRLDDFEEDIKGKR